MKPEKESRKIYISGPMTGLPGFNFAAFDAAESALEERGWHVVSPANSSRKNGVTADSVVEGPWLRQIQEQDLSDLLSCKAIYMLKGWRKSKGASAEFHVATWLGLEIQYEEGAEAVEHAPAEGVDPKGEAGSKKAPMWLLPPRALEAAAWVHGLGAKKYGPWNWRATRVKASTYISAIIRHLKLGYERGEDIDVESGQSHLAHIIACCNILIDAAAHGCLDDDRAKGEEVAK